VFDKIIKRVDVLFDESFGFEEHGKEEPFVFRCLDWIRKSEYFVDVLPFVQFLISSVAVTAREVSLRMKSQLKQWCFLYVILLYLVSGKYE